MSPTQTQNCQLRTSNSRIAILGAAGFENGLISPAAGLVLDSDRGHRDRPRCAARSARIQHRRSRLDGASPRVLRWACLFRSACCRCCRSFRSATRPKLHRWPLPSSALRPSDSLNFFNRSTHAGTCGSCCRCLCDPPTAEFCPTSERSSLWIPCTVQLLHLL